MARSGKRSLTGPPSPPPFYIDGGENCLAENRFFRARSRVERLKYRRNNNRVASELSLWLYTRSTFDLFFKDSKMISITNRKFAGSSIGINTTLWGIESWQDVFGNFVTLPISLGSWLTSIAIRSNYIREQITLRIVLRIFSTIPSRFQFLIIQTFRDNYIIRPKIVQQYNKLYRSRQRSRGEGDLQKMIQPLIHSFEHTFDRCGNSLRRCLLPKSSERIVERQRHGWTKRSNEQPSNRIVPVNVVFPCDSFACGRTRPKDRVIATTLHLYPPNDRSTPSSVS